MFVPEFKREREQKKRSRIVGRQDNETNPSDVLQIIQFSKKKKKLKVKKLFREL